MHPGFVLTRYGERHLKMELIVTKGGIYIHRSLGTEQMGFWKCQNWSRGQRGKGEEWKGWEGLVDALLAKNWIVWKQIRVSDSGRWKVLLGVRKECGLWVGWSVYQWFHYPQKQTSSQRDNVSRVEASNDRAYRTQKAKYRVHIRHHPSSQSYWQPVEPGSWWRKCSTFLSFRGSVPGPSFQLPTVGTSKHFEDFFLPSVTFP